MTLPESDCERLREIGHCLKNTRATAAPVGESVESTQGATVLFAGPNGTGKTTAAVVLGNELDLDLYRADLSRLVSEDIGETEKNLRRVFDGAEDGGAILLFDEADALFGGQRGEGQPRPLR